MKNKKIVFMAALLAASLSAAQAQTTIVAWNFENDPILAPTFDPAPSTDNSVGAVSVVSIGMVILRAPTTPMSFKARRVTQVRMVLPITPIFGVCAGRNLEMAGLLLHQSVRRERSSTWTPRDTDTPAASKSASIGMRRLKVRRICNSYIRRMAALGLMFRLQSRRPKAGQGWWLWTTAVTRTSIPSKGRISAIFF